MKLNLFTPEKTLLKEQQVQEVLVPSVKGYLGIFPGHAPLISLLQAGVLKYLCKDSKDWESVALGWGYLEVSQNDIIILAESAETKKTLDMLKSENELKDVLKKLEQWDLTIQEREKLNKKRLRLEGELKL